jgi:hypothetical protein
MQRLLIDIFLVILVFVFPWWIAFFLAVALLFVYRAYYEIILIGLIADALHGSATPFWGGFELVITLASVCLCIAAIFIKKRLKFYYDEREARE